MSVHQNTAHTIEEVPNAGQIDQDKDGIEMSEKDIIASLVQSRDVAGDNDTCMLPLQTI